jgi:GDP-L-fucose synthase
MIAAAFDIPFYKIVFETSKSDGQYKKTATNKKLRNLLPDYKFTALKDGIYETCKWFKENYNISRK